MSDGLVFLATISLAAALLYPAWSAREFRSRVTSAVTDVETLGAAARSMLQDRGAWPTRAAPGEAPPELATFSGEEGIFSRLDYTLGWTSWQVVDSVVAVDLDAAPVDPEDAPPDSIGPRLEPVIRTVGAVAVHSGDSALLAELSQRFADEISFVLDTTWLLVLPERGDAPAGGR
jgi:hypothetical protein